MNDLGENSLHVAIQLSKQQDIITNKTIATFNLKRNFCSFTDHAKIVEKLIEKGANVNHIAMDGSSALEKARGK